MSQSESDHELEEVDVTNDLVIFHDVQNIYNPDEDIFVVYQLGKSISLNFI